MIAQTAELGPFETHFVRLIDVPDLGLGFALIAIAIALGIGAIHALAPGHGKALIAAYLVGTRGRPRDALALGVIVSAMHTFSVLVLGVGLFVLTRAPGAGEQVTPWMMLVSGLLVLIVGVALVVRQVHRRRMRVAHALATDPDADTHGDHHHHLPEDVSPLSRRGVVLLGISGGLLPSPSAFLVLATALFMDRVAFGLALVAAFSIGLAATLTVIGLAAVQGRELITRRAAGSPRLSRLVTAMPLASALLIVGGGVYLTTAAALRLF